MNNLTFSFHETFPPQIIYLSEILKLSKENYCGTKEEISDLTGIPTGANSGKVMPHIKYLKYMGVINFENKSGKINLSLTELGEVIYESDPYFMERITKMILHYYVTHPKKGAPQWSYFFRNYNYNFNEAFSFNDVEKTGELKYGKNLHLGPVKSMYTGEDFSNINVLDFIDKDLVKIKSKHVLSESINIYAYTLLKDWEENFPTKNELTIDNLIKDLLWDRGFGFDYYDLLDVLDELSCKGYLKLNKHMNPISLMKNSTSNEILPFLYDDLF